MAHNRQKAKGRRESGAFLAVPFSVLESVNFNKLSGSATKLLFHVAAQLRIKRGGPINNGDLSITTTIMQSRGWTSRESLYSARDELLHYGFLQITRYQRFRSQCILYALTFFAIDECDGKLDVPSTRVAPNTWKQARPKWRKPARKNKSLYRKSAPVVPNDGTRSSKNHHLRIVS